ncbi:hypothetical protein AX774_g7765 [Zancudomyces culisetae]|uniref:Uncharacterized protein n=1 Tax=Zancudomyces culisetae TaxID=1213189 RepID=A0A1R1PCY2_ZANCU|nr:hypothetical protein AX774_g7765 [Zancudomyces culisetae]|eukprot:OMH78836.1 hypothetical protein AX774_g7765 [Zancudomyces culisetae]
MKNIKTFRNKRNNIKDEKFGIESTKLNYVLDTSPEVHRSRLVIPKISSLITTDFEKEHVRENTKSVKVIVNVERQNYESVTDSDLCKLLDYRIAKFFHNNGLSSDMIDDPSFTSFISLLRPSYRPPSTEKIATLRNLIGMGGLTEEEMLED